MIIQIKALTELIGQLKRFPGIGSRSAERIAYSILDMTDEEVSAVSEALLGAKKNITKCPICFSLTDEIPCKICQDPFRKDNLLCVVENPKDVIALEKAGNFKGRYHVLKGSLSPGKNIGPEDLKIKELIDRLNKEHYKEIVLALNPSVEGDATAMYLSKLLKPFAVKVTRIAHGLPIGGELEFADEMTLLYAFEDRKEIK